MQPAGLLAQAVHNEVSWSGSPYRCRPGPTLTFAKSPAVMMISFLGSIVLPHRLKNLLGCEGTDVPFKLLLPVEVAPLQLARESPRNCPVVCPGQLCRLQGSLGPRTRL